LLGTYVLPYILCTSLLANMTIPPVKYYFSFKILGLSVVFAIICSVLPAVYISVKELRETAAQLLLPKPPTKGSKIFMERITPLWSRMTFTQKVTARNIFRYKQRMLMTIFGVAGSVALLFAGLGISSSINGIQTKQYGQIIQYDAVVLKKDFVTEKEQTTIDNLLKSDEIQGYIPIRFETITEKIKGIEDEQTLSMLVTHTDTFSPYINLEHKNSEDKLKITNDGVVVSQKLADLMDRKVGDTITLKVLNEDRNFKISQITKMYAGHFVFMSDDYFAKVTGEKPTNNSYFISLKDKSKSSVEKATAKFMASNGVKAVSQNTNIIIQVQTMTNSLTKVMTVLTIMSLLLAIVILYNLTNINVAERIREL
ncbi:MAG: ABC transporter permease, partial [Finegoldia magna]|nr:ABC transporter permease [Finegoldia magna]